MNTTLNPEALQRAMAAACKAGEYAELPSRVFDALIAGWEELAAPIDQAETAHDAAGVPGRINGWLPDAHAVEVVLDGSIPAWFALNRRVQVVDDKAGTEPAPPAQPVDPVQFHKLAQQWTRDNPGWVAQVLTADSWQEWRSDNPEQVASLAAAHAAAASVGLKP